MTPTKGARVLSDLAATPGQYTAADEHRHAPPPDRPTWGETSWWAFTAPHERTAGWVYLLTRPNLGVSSLGVWIWDDTAAEPRELLHSKFYVHIPLAPGDDLTSLDLIDGLAHIEVVEPLGAYSIRYRNDDVDLDLRFRGLLPPQPVGIGPDTGHADQPLWANGTVTIGDRMIAIDGAAFRDRTWSDRPETMAGTRNCYSWAVADDAAFQLIALLDDDETPTWSAGFLWLDGTVERVTDAQRRVVEREPDGRPATIEAHLVDAAGRELRATGRCLNAAALSGFTGHLTWATLVSWDIDGRTVWGEDHDSWTHHAWRAARHG